MGQVSRETSIPTPVLLAEHVSPDIAATQMQCYETRRNSEGLFRSAWNYVEFGLNQAVPLDQERRRYYFDYAQTLVGMALAHPKCHQEMLLSGLILSTYIPLFQKRSLGQEIDKDDCRAVYESLGGAMRHLRPLRSDQSPQWRMAEPAVLALSARSVRPDLLLFPTSPREEASEASHFNHDSYFILKGGKLPVQQKLIETDKIYDEWMTVLTLQPLIEKSGRKSGSDLYGNLPEDLNYLVSLIVAETSNNRLDESEHNFLKRMSAGVTAHRWRAGQIRTAA